MLRTLAATCLVLAAGLFLANALFARFQDHPAEPERPPFVATAAYGTPMAEDIRERVATRLEHCDAPASWVAMVREVTRLEAADERRLFGESLPAGLSLVE